MRRLVVFGIVILVLLAAAISFAVRRDGTPGRRGSTPSPGRSGSPSVAGGGSPSGGQPGSSGYAARVLQDHPVAFWPLNDPSGTSARDLTGHYNGTYVGTPTPGAAMVNGVPAGTTFDGVNDRVTANAVTHVSSWPGYTMEVWVRLTQESKEEHIVAFNAANGGNGPGILHDQPTRKFKFRDCEGAGCAQVFSKQVPQLGIPYHLVVTVDANNQGAFYVNGVLQERFRATHRPPVDGLFTIGGEYDNGPKPESFFKGEIADVAIYNHGLSAAAVQAHYQAGR